MSEEEFRKQVLIQLKRIADALELEQTFNLGSPIDAEKFKKRLIAISMARGTKPGGKPPPF